MTHPGHGPEREEKGKVEERFKMRCDKRKNFLHKLQVGMDWNDYNFMAFLQPACVYAAGLISVHIRGQWLTPVSWLLGSGNGGRIGSTSNISIIL